MRNGPVADGGAKPARNSRSLWVGRVLLFGIVFAHLPGALSAQVTQGPPGPGLQEEALRFAQAWVNAEVDRLVPMLDTDGVRLQLEGGQNLLVPPHQAEAAINSFMKRYSGGEAELFRVSPVGGDASSGFAEFRWVSDVSGLRAPVIFTLFVGFARSQAGWIVTEIRVLP